MINKQTTLALNGPILSFTQTPVSVTVNHSGIATFTGIATASFPTQTPTNPALNDGDITYRWYASGVTDPLSDGTFRGATLSGTATTTLTVTGATSPTTNQSSFFLRADYTPSAYSQPPGSPVTAGTARSTGRDVAIGTTSTVGILTVRPFITITTQPQNATTATGGQAVFNVIATLSDSTFGNLSYQWQVNEQNLTDSSSPLISGSRSGTLIYSPTTTGTYNIRVIVTNANAQQVISNTATLTVVSPRSIVVFEGYNSQNAFQKVEQNLDNAANYTLSDTTFTHSPNIITFYASEKDIDAELSINVSKGSDNGSSVGGNGGSSRIRLTLQQNIEHTIVGIANNSAVFLYRGSNLIAVVGEGGDAGTGGNGGAGGGVNDAGQNGGGTGAGIGGAKQNIISSGIFGSASTVQSESILSGDTKANPPDGGRTITCSRGNYWIQKSIGQCDNNGVVQFVNADGTLITQSALITRGFKPGYTINATEGDGIGDNAGNGGGGATGGAGGQNSAGGGGGSGFISNTITALSSTIGGNSTTKSTVNFKIYVAPPPPTQPPAPPPDGGGGGGGGTPTPVCGNDYVIYRYGGGASLCSPQYPLSPVRRGRWYRVGYDENNYQVLKNVVPSWLHRDALYPVGFLRLGGDILSVTDAYQLVLNRSCSLQELDTELKTYAKYKLDFGSSGAFTQFLNYLLGTAERLAVVKDGIGDKRKLDTTRGKGSGVWKTTFPKAQCDKNFTDLDADIHCAPSSCEAIITKPPNREYWNTVALNIEYADVITKGC